MGEVNELSFIKKILYESYAIHKDYSLISDISNEIYNMIPYCSFNGFEISHDGIHLNFKCSNMDINKDDIEKATSYAIRNILLQNRFGRINPPMSILPNNVVNYLNNNENYESLFSVMFVRGMMFTVII